MPVSPALAFTLTNGGASPPVPSSSPRAHRVPPHLIQQRRDRSFQLFRPSSPSTAGNYASCLALPRDQTLQIFCTPAYQKSGAVNPEAEVAVRPARDRRSLGSIFRNIFSSLRDDTKRPSVVPASPPTSTPHNRSPPPLLLPPVALHGRDRHHRVRGRDDRGQGRLRSVLFALSLSARHPAVSKYFRTYQTRALDRKTDRYFDSSFLTNRAGDAKRNLNIAVAGTSLVHAGLFATNTTMKEDVRPAIRALNIATNLAVAGLAIKEAVGK